jgi:hypothetical protein
MDALTESLLKELALWLDAEKASPGILLESDNDLLVRVQEHLGILRVTLIINMVKKINDGGEASQKYEMLYRKLCDLLIYRIEKARIISERMLEDQMDLDGLVRP